MAQGKDYILYFYDGAVRQMRGVLSDLQKLPVKRIEEVVPGFDPSANVRRDMERINRALGKGFVMLQDVMNPQQLLRKIESGLDSVVPRRRY